MYPSVVGHFNSWCSRLYMHALTSQSVNHVLSSLVAIIGHSLKDTVIVAVCIVQSTCLRDGENLTVFYRFHIIQMS